MILAIDPGDLYVGWAHDLRGEVEAGEVANEGAVAFVETLLPCSELVIEAYVLYPGQDRKNVWNPMATSELIGKLKLTAERRGVPVVMQPASIKKPTRRQLRARGIRQIGRGSHARDAELHLYYRKLRNGEAA